jgi:hypothetical protein
MVLKGFTSWFAGPCFSYATELNALYSSGAGNESQTLHVGVGSSRVDEMISSAAGPLDALESRLPYTSAPARRPLPAAAACC